MTKAYIIDGIVCNCLLAATRRLSRVVTGIYEDELRPFNIKASQFNLLVVVAKAGPVRRIDIGRFADLDPSTLTRNLAVMLANGWIEEVIEGDDKRGNPVRVTAAGLRLIEDVHPGWKKAQQKARKLLGEHRAVSLVALFPTPTD
jgi:DNA-binding MarR family transcriptional regulator